MHPHNNFLTVVSMLFSEAFELLSDIGTRTTLRYAVQLLTPSAVTAKINARTVVSKGDVEEVAGLFMDAKASAKMLSESVGYMK